MLRSASVVVIAAAIVLLGAAMSCGGIGEATGESDAPWIAGEYVTTGHDELSDSCGFSTSFHQDPWLITQDVTDAPAAHAAIQIRDSSRDDGCIDISIRWHDGKWSWDGSGQREDGACVYDWTSHGLVVVSNEGLVLTETLQYEYVSGTCDGRTLPCDYSHSYRAEACDRCWPGCATTTATGRAIVLP